jgi:hypothetical protein
LDIAGYSSKSSPFFKWNEAERKWFYPVEILLGILICFCDLPDISSRDLSGYG